jgi:hypothetical protein
MTAFKTAMNNYQSFLQTNRKPVNFLRKGFNFLKCRSFTKNNISESWRELLLLRPCSVKKRNIVIMPRDPRSACALLYENSFRR